MQQRRLMHHEWQNLFVPRRQRKMKIKSTCRRSWAHEVRQVEIEHVENRKLLLAFDTESQTAVVAKIEVQNLLSQKLWNQ